MKIRILQTMLFVALLFASVPTNLIAKSARESKLEKQLKQMQTEMSTMKNQYETKLNDMDSKIDKLMQMINEKNMLSKSVEKGGDDDLAALRALAESEAEDGELEATKEVPEKSSVSFLAKNLSQQMQNPELSVTGDIVFDAQDQKGNRKKFDSTFRSMAIHFASYLDPDTKFKGAFPITENGTGLGEAYITREGFTSNMSLTLGRFRQQFGVINRWHKHALSQVDFPLALKRIFGAGGLNQNGISMDWHLNSKGSTSQDLQLQLTEANNGSVFGENQRGNPSALVHYKNYKDIDKDTYREIGITAMAGSNNQWNVTKAGVTSQQYDALPTYLAGLDFTYFWEPADNMRYRNFTWRSELYGIAKDVLAVDGTGRDTIRTWGGYTNLQWKLNRKYEAGIRYDYFRPDAKNYAELPGSTLGSLAVRGGNAYEWQVSPYVTLYQSPWVHYRLEFDYLSGGNINRQTDKRLMFQCIWAVGPHKHETY